MSARKNIHELRNTNFIILFDGVCNFCDKSVNFIIKRDTKDQFLYAPLNSEAGIDFIKTQSEKVKNTDSIILITKDKVYSKSRAAIKIASKLSGLWFLMSLFYIVPSLIRDSIYDYIAKNRYQWFGKLDSCKVINVKEKNKFLN